MTPLTMTVQEELDIRIHAERQHNQSMCPRLTDVTMLLTEIEALRGAIEDIRAMAEVEPPAAILALRNVRTLAARLKRTDPENAAHFLRFCASAGVVGSVLRGKEDGDETSGGG